MPVQRVTLAVTLLLEAETPSAAADQVQALNLCEIDRQIDTGDWIGQFEVSGYTQIHPDNVKPALEAMGNDGTFFDLLDQSDEDAVSSDGEPKHVEGN